MIDSERCEKVVYALGETVLDLITDDGRVFKAVPGGSVFNTSVSLSRCKINVQLISEYGNDKVGEVIRDFLKDNDVQTDFMMFDSLNKTSLALAFLDKDKNPSYTFYHDKPVNPEGISIPDFTLNDILLFGSYYAVKPERNDLVLKVLKKAVLANSIIYYDLNIRKAHLDCIEKLRSSYLNNIAVATIVKGSDEDFDFLLGTSDPDSIYERIKPFCKNLIITRGEKPVCVYFNGNHKSYNVKKIEPLSTIGAGDNFNAGFLFGLCSLDATLEKIQSFGISEIDSIIGFGLTFASQACMTYENYVPVGFEPYT